MRFEQSQYLCQRGTQMQRTFQTYRQVDPKKIVNYANYESHINS
jgi:hypothetical protein